MLRSSSWRGRGAACCSAALIGAFGVLGDYGDATEVASAQKQAECVDVEKGTGGVHFVPVVTQPGGRLGAGTLRPLSELEGAAAASRSRPSKAAFMRRALAELTCFCVVVLRVCM